jgi:type II secretory pathway pseudopilin PulG
VEVLITLGIIGIVAALTMPTLVANYQKQVIVTRLKKVYWWISNAYLNAQQEHGPVDTWYDGTNQKVNNQKFFEILSPYLKISKDCGFTGGCFKKANISEISGKEIPGRNYGVASSWYTIILADGTSVLLDSSSSGLVAAFYVDIDGLKGGSNTYGKDIFLFRVVDGRVIPSGLDLNEAEINENCSKTGSGSACAAKIMMDGWEIKDDYPW